MRVATISVEGRDVPAIAIGYLAGRVALLAVLSLAFVALGVFILLFDDEMVSKLIGGLCVLFFGAGTLVLLAMARRPGFVAFTRDGIAAESRFATAFAPWDAVTGVGRQHIGRNEMIVVDVGDPARIRTSRGTGWLKRLNAMAGYPDLAFPTNLLGSGSEVLEAGVRAYATDPERRARIGRQDELDALLAESGREAGGAVADGLRPPWLARVTLWTTGALGTLTALAGVLAEGDPERATARLIGASVFGATSLSALAAAWLVGRRPRAGRIVGLVSAGGMLFIALLALTRGDAFNATVVIGLVVLAAGILVGWQLYRWRPAASRERGRGMKGGAPLA